MPRDTVTGVGVMIVVDVIRFVIGGLLLLLLVVLALPVVLLVAFRLRRPVFFLL